MTGKMVARAQMNTSPASATDIAGRSQRISGVIAVAAGVSSAAATSARPSTVPTICSPRSTSSRVIPYNVAILRTAVIGRRAGTTGIRRIGRSPTCSAPTSAELGKFGLANGNTRASPSRRDPPRPRRTPVARSTCPAARPDTAPYPTVSPVCSALVSMSLPTGGSSGVPR